MKKPNWDDYFYSHYSPEGAEWGKKDLLKYRHWYRSWVPYIENKLHMSFKGKDALELGCGIGSFSTLLYDAGAKVVGSDIAEVMVGHASILSPEIPFITYDIMKRFPQKKLFDFILGFEVLEHIPNLDIALEHIYSLLKKDGWFIGSTPYPYKKNMIDPTHVNVHLPAFWKTNFFSHHFESVQTYPMSFLPLMWRIPFLSFSAIPMHVPLTYVVSTTLIFAQKK